MWETDQGKNVKSQSIAIMLKHHLFMWCGFCHLSALPGVTGSPDTDNQHNKQLPQSTVGEPQVVCMNCHALTRMTNKQHILHCNAYLYVSSPKYVIIHVF